MRGVILEGIPGSGKSYFYRQLLGHLAECWHGPIWMASEHITERTLEPLALAEASAANMLAQQHLDILNSMSSLEECAPRGDNTEIFVIIERFHLSLGVHVNNFPGQSFEVCEDFLQKRGMQLLWFALPEEKIQQFSIEETILVRNPKWESWLKTLGETPEQQAEYFIAEQRLFGEIFSRSILSRKKIQPRVNPTVGYIRGCYEFLGLEST